MNVNIIDKDIFQAFDDHDFVMLVHQVNCQGVMGAGIAKEIKKRWPEHFNVYKEECDVSMAGNLGTFVCPVIVGKSSIVSGLYAQSGYGGNANQTYYSAFTKALSHLTEWCDKNYIRSIGLPYKIGCGLARGDWEVIKTILDDCNRECVCDITIYRLPE